MAQALPQARRGCSVSDASGPPPRRRRPGRGARRERPPPAPPAPGGRWSSRALVLALLVGAWVGRQAAILPEAGERILDLAIAVGIAVMVALGYRRLARRYRRPRSGRSSRR